MSKIDELTDLTKGLQGMFTPFSQSQAGIKGARSVQGLYTNDKQNVQGNANELYVGGMCHIMSMFWIVGQIEGVGPNKTLFIDWVLPGGLTGAPNMDAVGVLVAKTVMYKAKGPKAASQGIKSDKNFDETFFALHRIRPKNEEFNGFYGIWKAVGRAKDRFYMVSYGSGTGGHACAAQSTSEGGFAYFDPNYGAASLFSHKAWEDWYPEYLRISNYKNKYGGAGGHQGAEAYKSISSG